MERRGAWSLTCSLKEGYREDGAEVFSEVHQDGQRDKELKLC